ncbi:unnamed protein product [Closterium sp. Naga37s-1]|nr:unnamed protein product [Closterium sp. Naga37s-1]
MLTNAIAPVYPCSREQRLGVSGEGGKVRLEDGLGLRAANCFSIQTRSVQDISKATGAVPLTFHPFISHEAQQRMLTLPLLSFPCIPPFPTLPLPSHPHSVGSKESYSFEEDIAKATGAVPLTFDPFISQEAQQRMLALPFLRYFPEGLSGRVKLSKNRKMFPSYTFSTLPELMATHSSIYMDVLKIDCEGCEIEMIRDLEQAMGGDSKAGLVRFGGKLPFGQLLLEFHKIHVPKVTLPLIYAIENLGYRIFHVEMNPLCSKCMEKISTATKDHLWSWRVSPLLTSPLPTEPPASLLCPELLSTVISGKIQQPQLAPTAVPSHLFASPLQKNSTATEISTLELACFSAAHF